MKRKLALFLTLFFLVGVLVPVQTFAAEDKGLESAIKTAKSLLEIDDSYSEFDYYSYTNNGKTVWSLYWSKEAEGSIYVEIDDRGTLISYDHYKYNDYEQRKLPKYSKEQALELAREFINKVNPEALKLVKNEDISGVNYLNDPYYYFNFYRVHDGVPFYDNRIGVSVNKQTGKIHSYYYSWLDNLRFPDKQKSISLEEAQKSYEKNLGLRLVYKFNGNRKNPKVYLAYVPVFESTVVIDALTGEKIDLYPDFVGGAGGSMKDDSEAAEKKAGNVRLSPEELEAIQQVSKLLSQDRAEAIARNIKQLEITDDYKLTNAGISRNWMYQNEFTWELYFEKNTSDKEKAADYINVTLDGKTGELEGFYRRCDKEDEPGKAKFDKEGARAAVEEFLQSVIPQKFKDLNYEDSPEYEIYPAGESPKHYYFTYSRLVDGVPFLDNTVTVNIDAYTGKVENFRISWADLEFPDKNTAISIDKAYANLFGKIGLKLQYKTIRSEGPYRPVDTSAESEEPLAPEVALVYMLDQNKPNQLDAVTGEILNYDGTLYKENKPVVYTDISGHFAEKEIAALAEFGITLPGTKFRPNDSIVQKDFLNLLAKIENWPSLSGEETQEEIDRMYAYLIRNGIVKADEKNPAARVTREESIKFVVRALGYGKVAELPGIFVCRFSDANDISESMLGYVAIAGALNLVNGDSQNRFNPAKYLARGEAALIIYRMLLVE